jgi:hypothetical protein
VGGHCTREMPEHCGAPDEEDAPSPARVAERSQVRRKRRRSNTTGLGSLLNSSVREVE